MKGELEWRLETSKAAGSLRPTPGSPTSFLKAFLSTHSFLNRTRLTCYHVTTPEQGISVEEVHGIWSKALKKASK